MRVQDQEVTFNAFNAIKLPAEEEECFLVDLEDGNIKDWIQNPRTDESQRYETGENAELKVEPLMKAEVIKFQGAKDSKEGTIIIDVT